MQMLLWVLLLAQEPGGDAKALVEAVISGAEDRQREGADELVKLGKDARKVVADAWRKQTKPEPKARLEDVLLRIDAGTDAESGEVGPLTLLLSQVKLTIETNEKAGNKRVLHIELPLSYTSTSSKNEDLVMKKATLILAGEKVDLVVTTGDKKSFGWLVQAGASKTTSYHNLVTPKWKKGTRALLAVEFECAGKTLKLRTPVGEMAEP